MLWHLQQQPTIHLFILDFNRREHEEKDIYSNIFYYDVKIADSLEEFLIKIQEDDNYYLERIV